MKRYPFLNFLLAALKSDPGVIRWSLFILLIQLLPGSAVAAYMALIMVALLGFTLYLHYRSVLRQGIDPLKYGFGGFSGQLRVDDSQNPVLHPDVLARFRYQEGLRYINRGDGWIQLGLKESKLLGSRYLDLYQTGAGQWLSFRLRGYSILPDFGANARFMKRLCKELNLKEDVSNFRFEKLDFSTIS